MQNSKPPRCRPIPPARRSSWSRAGARPLWLLFATALLWTHQTVADTSADLDSARALFERNLDSIRQKDRAAYLATYLQSENFARSGVTGVTRGYESHAAAAGDAWPDVFHAADLQLVPVSPGVVYGTYRYRVRYGSDEATGLSERVFLRTPAGWRIAVTTAFPAPAGTPPPPLGLVGATVFDGTDRPPVAGANILVRGGKIDCVGTPDSCRIPGDIDVVDVSGTWITPGLIDAHVHLSQTGWIDGRPDVFDASDRWPYEQVQAALREDPGRWFRSYLACGVTGVFDVGGYAWTWSLRDTTSTSQPHVAACGPPLSTRDYRLSLPAERQFICLEDSTAARRGVDYLAAQGSDAVKVAFVTDSSRDFTALEATVLAAGDAAREAGLPLVVHATDLREAKVALRTGAQLLVPGVEDTLVDDEFLELARRTGVIYCPTLTAVVAYKRLHAALATGRAPEVDVPQNVVDPQILQRVGETPTLQVDETQRQRSAEAVRSLEKRQQTMVQNLRRVHAAGIPIALGTGAGTPLTLHGGSVFSELEAMQKAGMSPLAVLEAATRNAARALGRQTRCGTLEPGKWADLLIVEASPADDIANLRCIRAVMRRGELRQRDELLWH